MYQHGQRLKCVVTHWWQHAQIEEGEIYTFESFYGDKNDICVLERKNCWWPPYCFEPTNEVQEEEKMEEVKLFSVQVQIAGHGSGRSLYDPLHNIKTIDLSENGILTLLDQDGVPLAIYAAGTWSKVQRVVPPEEQIEVPEVVRNRMGGLGEIQEMEEGDPNEDTEDDSIDQYDNPCVEVPMGMPMKVKDIKDLVDVFKQDSPAMAKKVAPGWKKKQLKTYDGYTDYADYIDDDDLPF